MLDILFGAAPVLLLGALVQTAAGFGVGMVAVPLLLWLNWDLPAVIAAVLGSALGQAGYGLIREKEHFDISLSLPVGLAQWGGIPLGVAVMTTFLAESPTLARQVAGALLLVVVVAGRWMRPVPRAHRPLSAALLTGGSAGFLSGSIGMGGPPLVFFALAHDWSVAKFRAYLWSQFLFGAPLLIAVLAWRAGWVAVEGLLVGVLCMPAVWLGTWIGFRLTKTWDRALLDRVSLMLLVGLGISTIGTPFFFG